MNQASSCSSNQPINELIGISLPNNKHVDERLMNKLPAQHYMDALPNAFQQVLRVC